MNKFICKTTILMAISGVVLALMVVAAKATMEPATEPNVMLPGGKLIELNEDNWRLMLEGEWMVGIFAPWCQSCKDIAPTWENFAYLAATVPVQVAKIEVNQAPSLSGRFLVTYVPKIYHVKDGEFRQYRGAIYDGALLNFVTKEMWKGMQPLPFWQKPSACHMALVGFFAKVSHNLKGYKLRLQVVYGLPEFAAYMLVASSIVIMGVSTVSLLMSLIDFVNGPKPLKKKRQSLNEKKEEQQPVLVESVEDLKTEEIEEIEDNENNDNEQQNDQIQELGSETIDQDVQTEEQQEQEEENDDTLENEKDEEKDTEQAGNSSSPDDEVGSELEKIKLKLVGDISTGKPEKEEKNRNRESRQSI